MVKAKFIVLITLASLMLILSGCTSATEPAYIHLNNPLTVPLDWQGDLSAAPATPSEGMAYHNTTDGKSYYYDGSTWQTLAEKGSTGATGTTGSAGPNIVSNGVTDTDITGLLSGDGSHVSAATSIGLPTGRGATYIIAASDSSATDKAQADLVCPATNPEVQLQTAFTANGGKKIVMLPGTYTIGTAATVTSPNLSIPSNTTLEIQGLIQLAVVGAVASPNLFLESGVTNVHFEGLGIGTIDGQAASQVSASGTPMAINFTNVTYSSIRDMNLKNMGLPTNDSGYGIYLNGSTYNSIEHNYGYANKRCSFTVYNGSNYNRVNYNISAADGSDGFNLHSITDCSYNGNIVVSAGTSGFTIQTSCARIYLNDNKVYSTAYSGISIGSNGATSSNIYINNGSVTGCNYTAGGQGAIDVEYCTGFRITNCYLANNKTNEIYVANSSNGVISGNKLLQQSSTNTNGINLASTATSINIRDNDLISAGYTNLVLNASPSATFLNNIGYIGIGEVRTYSGSITAGGAGTYTSKDNPFGQVVRVLDLQIYITTADADAPNIDSDLNAANNSVAGLSLFDDLPGETTGYYLSTLATPGKQTVPQTWGSGSGNRYLNIAVTDNDGSQLVGTYTVTVMGN